MAKYRKKPVVIEAMHYDGANTLAVVAWVGESAERRDGTLVIYTLEGEHYATPGDFIIRGIKGEFYPCKPDIFAATYEPVEEATRG